MRIIAKRTLTEFWSRYPDAQEPLQAWYREAVASKWTSPQSIKSRYRTASFVGSDRVVFNIRGNNYRLVVKVIYDYSLVYIRFLGTHSEYDRINATEI